MSHRGNFRKQVCKNFIIHGSKKCKNTFIIVLLTKQSKATQQDNSTKCKIVKSFVKEFCSSFPFSGPDGPSSTGYEYGSGSQDNWDDIRKEIEEQLEK